MGYGPGLLIGLRMTLLQHSARNTLLFASLGMLASKSTYNSTMEFSAAEPMCASIRAMPSPLLR